MDTVRKSGVVHEVNHFPDERNWGVTICGLPIGPGEKGEEETITCPQCLKVGSSR
jgi:hypothetical protein